jgi:hypothetical protein
MSLPFEFNTNLQSIPNSMPYISANASMVANWQKKLGETSCLRVGLTWAGNPSFVADHKRSLDFSQLSPLLKLSGIQFFSLQKCDAAPQAKILIDFTDELNDFADTAALISQLDLVISVDTSVAHLAGSLGKPVWLLSRFDGSWRWLLDRDDTPWYPTMRLFRQEQSGDWLLIIGQIEAALNEFASQQGI